MEYKMHGDDVGALIALLKDSTDFNSMNSPMLRYSVDTLTVPAALQQKVQAVMQRPNWREEGRQRVLQEFLEILRFRHEQNGMTVDGQRIPTDPANRVAIELLKVLPGKMLPWKDSGSGQWIDFDEAKLHKVQDALAAYLQRVSEAELKIFMQISQGRIKTKEDVEKQFNAAMIDHHQQNQSS
jgi:hypothetical protein